MPDSPTLTFRRHELQKLIKAARETAVLVNDLVVHSCARGS